MIKILWEEALGEIWLEGGHIQHHPVLVTRGNRVPLLVTEAKALADALYKAIEMPVPQSESEQVRPENVLWESTDGDVQIVQYSPWSLQIHSKAGKSVQLIEDMVKLYKVLGRYLAQLH